jgi:hypothetical protein
MQMESILLPDHLIPICIARSSASYPGFECHSRPNDALNHTRGRSL